MLVMCSSVLVFSIVGNLLKFDDSKFIIIVKLFQLWVQYNNKEFLGLF